MKENSELQISPMRKKIITAVLLAVFLVLSGAVAVVVGKPMVEFVREPERFREFVSSYGFISDIVFIFMVIFQIVLAIIPGEPFEIAAGYAFGYIRGTVDCLIAFLIAGLIVFLAVRKFGVKIVEVFFPIEKIRELKFLNNPKRLNTLAFILFLIPGTPKDLLTYFVGLTDMKITVWMFITVVARIPSLITSVLAGGALGSRRYGIAIAVFAVTLAISGIGLLVYRRITKRNST